ncbi:uncharacterized protein LOC128661511 [Bombina bombina]|uniref:uncharacterized protein LOC128661511 n=1 Tax=Bombina bombina TaxID=8345 RepID=UPI00235A5A63|nr:uncharacterized protein LOC128661511 [Bombina bombina]
MEKHSYDHLFNHSARCSEAICLPYGDSEGKVAIYRSDGPYIQNVSISHVNKSIQTGEAFILQISGYLANSSKTPFGIPNLFQENVSTIQIKVNWSTHDASYYVTSIQINGYFTSSIIWTYKDYGNHSIRVCIENSISVEELEIHVDVLIPEPNILEITIAQTEEDIPSCIPYDVNSLESLVRVYFGLNYQFCAFVAMGTDLNFNWFFTDDKSSYNTVGLEHNKLLSIMNHTFTKEGLHQIHVNVSNKYNWIAETVNVAVVKKMMYNLTLHMQNGYVYALRKKITLDIIFFTTSIWQPVFLNISFEQGVILYHHLSEDLQDPRNTDHIQIAETYGLHQCYLHFHAYYKYKKPGNYNVSVSVGDGSRISQLDLPQLIHIYDPIIYIFPNPPWQKYFSKGLNVAFEVISLSDKTGSQCQWSISKPGEVIIWTSSDWHINISFEDSGNYLVSVTCYNPISSATYVMEIEVQNAIGNLTLSRSNEQYIQNGAILTFNATTDDDSSTTYIWDFSTNKAPIVNQHISATHIYTQPGTHTQLNNVINITDSMQLIVQDPVGHIALDLPQYITVNHVTSVLVSVTSGSDVSLDLYFNGSLTYQNITCTPNTPVMVFHNLTRIGQLEVKVIGLNLVSQNTVISDISVVEELHEASIDIFHKTMLGEDIILAVKVNGQLWSRKHYVYKWTLASNATYISGSPTLIYRCTTLGTHTIVVAVTNLASTVSCSVHFNVMPYKTVPGISHLSNAVLGESVVFTLKNIVPEEESVILNFGDGTNTVLMALDIVGNSFNVSHTYRNTGIYKVCLMLNPSATEISSVIVIQEPVKGLTLHGPKTVALSFRSEIPSFVSYSADIVRGSNYVYRWFFSDSETNSSHIGLPKLKDAELKHMQHPKLASTLDHLTKIRYNLNNLLAEEIHRKAYYLKKLYFVEGNRAGPLLAKTLKRRTFANYIHKMSDTTSKEIYDCKGIANAFSKYYSSLYNILPDHNTQNSTLIDKYLEEANLPSIPDPLRDSIDKPFSEQEVAKAIKTFPTHKSPGPDGLTNSYYKHYQQLLVPHLTNLFNSLDEDGLLSPQLLEAHIAVIHKEGKPTTEPSSYRPISLLNSDIKIYAKVIAHRINSVLPDLIHLDQAGFVPLRETRDNTIRITHILDYANIHKIPMFVVSTDAEKAFDRVAWPFLRSTLHHYGFGSTMINRIFQLYSSPSLKLDLVVPCNLTIDLQVEDSFGSLWARMTTVVQYPILNVSMTIYRTIVGQPTRIIVVVEPQQDYTVLLDFGDGDSISIYSHESLIKGCFYSPLFCSVLAYEHNFTQASNYTVTLIVSNAVSRVEQVAEAVVEEPIVGMDVTLVTPHQIKLGDLINATVYFPSGSEFVFTWLFCGPFTCYSLSGSSVSIAANVSGTWNLTTFISSPFYGYPWIPTHVEYVKVLGPIDAFKAYLPFGTDHATLIEDENGFYSTKTLEFRASSAVETSFVFHFGDGSPSVYIKGNVQGSRYGASAYHRFKKAGVFIIRVIAFNEFFNATQELGPYYVEIAPKDLLLAMNSSTVHKDETILFKASLKTGTNVSYRWSINNKAIYGNEGPVIIYKFSTAATYNITVVAVNKVGNQTAWKIVSVQYKMKPVSIFTNGTIFSTGTSIRFYVITEEAGNLKFFWHFGDGKSETTTSTSISKTYTKPNRYNVIVTASNEISSITSDIHTIFIQSRVIPHSLVASSSVLVDASVTFECRTNSRANINYLWNFGDGSIRPGNNKTENHVFTREGEFTVNVLVFNNVSSAFLTKQIFVVKEPCQPPPVKIIGPTNQIQIRRYEHLHLRVTFEAPILCNISQGLHYYWSFVKSDGNLLSLPAHIENKRQAITLPKFFLAYGKYTAVAKVQIVGTIVYSNYTVPIEVLPTDPVSVIAEGTHLFIDQNTVKNITLNGTSSFDPDNPAAQLRFHWRCAPVSTHTDSCFKSSVSSPFQSSDEVIIFQTALLNSNFDQFHFTLNVSSGDRMSTDAHVFLSMKPKSNFRLVHLHCFECKGSSINWNEKNSVQPVCSDCSETDDLSYSWNLYWINATDTINIEVPFCHAIEGMRHSGLHGLISMETSAEASMMQVTPSLASHATSSHLETTPEPSAFEGISNDTKTLESVSFNGESTESTFQETNFGRTVSQEGENDNISPTASAFDLTMLDMSNPLLGPLEEGSSGGRYARGRRSAVGTMSNNAHSDTSDDTFSVPSTTEGIASASSENPSIYKSFKEYKKKLFKEQKLKWEISSLEKYVEMKMIPRGLRIRKRPGANLDNPLVENFQIKWDEYASKCSTDWMNLMIEENKLRLEKIQKELSLANNEVDAWKGKDEYERLMGLAKVELRKIQDSIKFRKKKKYQRDWQDYQDKKVYDYTYSASSGSESEISSGEENKTQNSYREQQQSFLGHKNTNQGEGGGNINGREELQEEISGQPSQTTAIGFSDFKKKSEYMPALSSIPLIHNFVKLVERDIDLLSTNEPLPDNLTKKQRTALKALQNDITITIKPSDKGGNIVVLNTKDYVEECQRQLRDIKQYSILRFNPTEIYKEKLFQILMRAKDEGVINQREFDFLFVKFPKTATFYSIPKLHKNKLPPPGRPIISDKGSLTEKISQYVDFCLRPNILNLPSYIKDTLDVLKKLNDISVSANTLLVAIDVESLYSSIPHDKGVEVIKYFLIQRGSEYDKHTNFILELLSFILKHNYFVFGNKCYQQNLGTAMGTCCGPTFACLYLGKWEFDQILNSAEINDSISLWLRFIDDVFLLWEDTEMKLIEFMQKLNNNEWNLKFTYTYSKNEITFLDLRIINDNNCLKTATFRKDTAGTLNKRFKARGYTQQCLKKAFNKTKSKNRDDLLYEKSDDTSESSLVRFIGTYNQKWQDIRSILNKHWHILWIDKSIGKFVGESPLMTPKRAPNLKDFLVQSHFENKNTGNWLTNKKNGNFKCLHCSVCTNMLVGKNFCDKFGSFHTIKGRITCKSEGVVYMVSCNCPKYYIGLQTFYDSSRSNKRHFQEVHGSTNWTSRGFISGEGGFDLSMFIGNHTTTDFDTHLTSIQEGRGGSRGRSEGEISSIPSSLSDDEIPKEEEGDNLVDVSRLDNAPAAILMIDWFQHHISNSVFHSYTASGISSQTVIFNPFVLKSSNMYMLDLSIASRGNIIGKSQLYFTVNEMPQRITCAVRYKEGFELHTVFSIFCTSGQKDLHYEFSYQTGRSSRKILYKGRDNEYYFSLPSGDPAEFYRVTIFMEITNRFGSKTQQCPVNVTVLPIFARNTTGTMPEWDLYHNGLKNLSTLLLMGNHIEIRNYVVLVTEVLNRLYTEESKDPFDLQRKLQRKLRNSLISSVCSLPFQDQDEVTDITSMLTDLLNKTKQITTDSVTCIINAVKTIVKEYVEPVNHKAVLLDRTLSENLISLISKAMEISYNYSERNNYVILDGMKSISDLMLKYITMNNELQFNISTSLLEIQVNVHQNSQKDIQSIGSTRFNLPPLIDRHSIINIDSNNKCYISQLVHFKKNPYFWAVTSSQLHGEFAGLDVFHCSTRRKINVREFIMPVTMEFENQLNNVKANENKFILARDKVNYHHFTATSKNKEEVLQITITFSDPNTRAFPVLVLVRYPEKPSTTHFNVKHIHYWEGNTTQIFISADSIRDRGSGYLALMDADYNRVPKNKYLSSQINYTINVQWAQCLFWDNYKRWKSEDCYPQKGTTAARINCSCKHLGMFTISSRHVNTQMNIEDVEQFIHAYTNVVPCAIVFLFILLYIVLLTFCKLKDKHEEKKNDCVLLQDNSPSDQQQYAIIVDIGFRSRPKSTAKVHIVLHGEDGVSETRELYCPDKPLFERNSRHTFIMSIPDSLGPIWKIHIWHNNSGDCPSLYLSHVIIKDLKYGTSWFFHAECWLAVDEGDGKVEREFTSTGHGLGFKKLFYCKLTEYLEDFHLWCSVLSRPSYSWFTHTQRITICLVLFLGYMSLNIVLIHWKEEQYTAEMGFIDISTVSMITGLQATMTIYPVALLLSLLFRFSEKKIIKDSGEERFKAAKESEMYSIEGHQNSLSAVDTMLESNLTWQHFQYWAYDAWKKKYERDFFTPSVHSVNSSKRSEKGSPLPSNQSSSGFEDGSNNSHKPDPRDYKQSKNDLCSEYSSDRSSLFENSVFHGYKVLPPWCVYVAWSLCALFSLSCVIVTVLVGFRFGPSKCILYLHALFFSLIYCIFIIQPFMIFLTALFVAWWKREQTDFFAEELRDATKYFLSDPMLFSQNFALYNQQNTHELVTNFDKILAARKRARYLRLARPPTPAQLRIVREKIRKKTLIQQTFWEFVMHIVMIFILLFIALGKFSHHEYILNQAVRNEFTRDAEHTFSKIKTEDEWWDWSVSTLLDGLYWDKWYNKAYATAEAGPIGGKFFLVGTPVLRQLRAASESTSSEEAKIPKRQVPLKIPPTLLVLSLPSQEEEPLAAKIRTSPDVSGVEIMNHECKLTLFADDILLSLMKPLVSLPNLYKLLDDYAEISGYKSVWKQKFYLKLNGTDELRIIHGTQDMLDYKLSTIPPILAPIIHGCIPPPSIPVHSADMLNVTNVKVIAGIQDDLYFQCSKAQCYRGKGPIVSLGRSRAEAYSTLSNLKKHKWTDRRTRALSVQFVLYNPPTNLFTMVSLLTELPATGGLMTSSVIDSVRIYRITTVLDYIIMVFELTFLGLILIHFYYQLSIMIQKGVKNYWQDSWNWIEVCIVVLSLCYFTNHVYHFMLTMDIIDLLQKGFFRVFIDFSFIAEMEKRSRSLYGIILFFMTIKCLRLLRIYKVMAPCMAMLRLSCSSTLFTMTVGVVFTLAYSSLGHVLFLSSYYSFSTVVTSFQTVLILLLGAGGAKPNTLLHSQTKSDHVTFVCFYGSIFIVMTLLWSGMLRGILMSVAKHTKKAHRSKHLITFKEMISHAREKVLSIIGRQKTKSIDSSTVAGNNFYLDEFEDLIDELLFRLNAISNSLHHSLPAKTSCYTEEEEEANNFETSSDYYFNQTFENHMLNEEGVQQEVMRGNLLCVDTVIITNEKSSGKLNHTPRSLCEKPCGNSINAIEEFSTTQHQTVSCISLGEERKSIQKAELEDENLTDSDTIICRASKESYGDNTNRPAQTHVKDVVSTAAISAQYMEWNEQESDQLENTLKSQTRCTSANILCKNRRPLKRSHTTVIELLDGNRTSVWSRGDKITAGEEQSELQQQVIESNLKQSPIFQVKQFDMRTEKNTEQKYTQNTKQKRFEELAKRNKETSTNLMNKVSGDDLPCSVKQCW